MIKITLILEETGDGGLSISARKDTSKATGKELAILFNTKKNLRTLVKPVYDELRQIAHSAPLQVSRHSKRRPQKEPRS